VDSSSLSSTATVPLERRPRVFIFRLERFSCIMCQLLVLCKTKHDFGTSLPSVALCSHHLLAFHLFHPPPLRLICFLIDQIIIPNCLSSGIRPLSSSQFSLLDSILALPLRAYFKFPKFVSSHLILATCSIPI